MPKSHSFPLAGLTDLLPQWTQKMKISASTKKSYQKTVSCCIAWLQKQGASEFDWAGIEAWMQKDLLSKSSHLQPSSASNYRGVARNFLAWLEKESAGRPEWNAEAQEKPKEPERRDADAGQPEAASVLACMLRPLFSRVRDQINKGAAFLRRPVDRLVRSGSFFLVRGMLCYAAAVQEDGQGANADAIFKVVCETGEETDVPLPSFIDAMQNEKDAWLVAHCSMLLPMEEAPEAPEAPE